MKTIKNIFTVPKLNKEIIVIFILAGIQAIYNNLGHPVTPKLVKTFDIPDIYFGIFFAAMSLGLTIGAPIWGILGDKFDKRVFISLGLIVYAIGQYLFAYSGNLYIMIGVRFISGFGVSASLTLYISHILEFTERKDRSTVLAWNAALMMVGTSIGYFLGGFLHQNTFFIRQLNTDDLRVIFLIQSVLIVGHAFVGFFLLSKDKKETTLKSPSFIDGLKNIRKLNLQLFIFFISLTLISLGAINISKFIEVYMNELSYTPLQIGQFVGATGIVSLLASIFVVPVLAKLKKDFPLMIVVQALSAIIIFIVFRSNQLMLTLYTFFMLYVVLKTVYRPLEQNYIATHAKDNEYGTLMGLRQAFFSLGLVFGPLIGGVLYEIKPLWVFDFSALMFVVAFILLLIIRKKALK
ncbi:MAG: MFS transporter [Candidatus Izimaplasma sp.]|nr:MFS transporter [Candidatus Izimaplasma bacterium]